jgi:DNA-binding SARP family transcriptional activator/Flp pilus assembly protein TadD
MTPILRLFGGAALIASDGQAVGRGAAQPRRLAVLALLADAWPTSITRDRIVGMLWPDQDEAGARRLLTQALYELRRELGPFVRGSAHDLTLDTQVLRVDLLEFREALASGDLERAVASHRGVLLNGFHLRGAPEFERWADTARDETRRQFQQAIESLAQRDEDAGRFREAARWLEQLLPITPFDASLVLKAMRLLERAGNPGGALAAAAAYERRMREDLELAPDPDVISRVEDLRARALPAPSSEVEAPRISVVDDTAPLSGVDDGDLMSPAPPPLPANHPSTLSPDAVRSRLHPRRVLRLGVGGAAVLLAVMVFVKFARRSGEPAPVPSLHIGAFVVRGDSAEKSLGADVATVLVANLDGVAGVRARRDDPSSIDAGSFTPNGGDLSGEVIVRGRLLTLNAQLHRPSGSPPTTVTVTGARDSVLALAEQLSIALLPALYPEGDKGLLSNPSSWFSRAEVLRRFLDGEAALRRGAFDDAYSSFTRASELAPGMAVVWYRRAIAAEEAHRSDDADHSAAMAESLGHDLPEREQQLIRGYVLWRAGDAVAADSLFRRLVRADSRDREAWMQLAEIAYHAGPLLGRPLEEARDPWRQVVALDSGDVHALVHAIRLESRARDTSAVNALLRRASEARATESALAESRIIAAFAVGVADDKTGLARKLDVMPDYSLGFLQGIIAGLLERPADAEGIARRMTDASRPVAVQGQGHLMLAHLALARGRWRQMSRELDLAAGAQPVTTAWYRAYFATLPFLQSTVEIRARASDALAAAAVTPTTAPLSLQLAVDVPAAPMIHRYLEKLLLLGDSSPAMSSSELLTCAVARPTTSGIAALCHDLQLGLLAEQARRSGKATDALQWLESLDMRVPYQFAGRSMFFARSRERFLRAELLERAGRLREADDWYAAVPHGAWMDHIYLAPTHLRRGRIHEQLGDRAGAAEHYRQVAELWRDHDPELAGFYREALEGLRRTAGASSAAH